MPKRVLFRADAGDAIGLGHLIRCVALAQYLCKMDVHVDFITTKCSDEVRSYMQKQPFHVYWFPHKSFELSGSQDHSMFSNYLTNHYDWVVLDNYYFDESYEVAVRRNNAKLMRINDVYEFSDHVNLAVNHALRLDKEGLTVNTSGNQLFGNSYAMIRNDLSRDIFSETKSCHKLIIMLGGGSYAPIVNKMIASLEKVKDFSLEVKVLSGISTNYHVSASRYHKIELVKPTFQMASLLNWADLAICAGGSSVWELCYFGVTGLVGILSHNQVHNVSVLNQYGAFKSVGWFERLTIQELTEHITNLLNDKKHVEKMRKHAISIIDGQGVRRIYEAMFIKNENKLSEEGKQYVKNN